MTGRPGCNRWGWALVMGMSILWLAPVGGMRAAEGPYRPQWDSLAKHPVPQWFCDAKFGIYTHWGPVTVGAEDGPSGVQWYGRNMYRPDSPTFQYHREKYGDQHTVGYKDMIRRFTADKFDAAAWADLFAAAGARFAGPVVIHHDNYALWDSALTRWDCKDIGPGRDITGELAREIRKRGMKFIAAFHHGFTWRYYEPAYRYDAADGRYADLYCTPHRPGDPPDRRFLEQYLAKIREVVVKYQPDLLYFDFGLGKVIPTPYQQRMFADYYNWAAAHHRDVAVTHKHWEIHEHTGIIDFERGRMNKLADFPWMTDTSIGPWFYQKSVPYKTADQVVDILVDIVSKNGCLLLNVGPRADGTFDQPSTQILRHIGAWLKVNGQAIFGTRPWQVYGEGPTRLAKAGGFNESNRRRYTAADIRFTCSKDRKTLYVIALDWPADGRLVVHSLGRQARPDLKIGSARLLGHQSPLSWSRQPQALTIELLDRPVGRYAFVVKLELQ